MKKLSIEEKVEAYDKVSKEVKDFFEGKRKMCSNVTKALEDLFPELKESEDERVRKELLAVINDLVLPDDQQSRFVAWLEKQGEQKSIDEVKPKFKVGDWIVCCDYEPVQIIGITKNDYYEMSNGDNRPIYMVDNNPNIRLWSSQDTKNSNVRKK